MSTSRTFEWEKESLGAHIQYPGHPLVLATMIMDRYPSLDIATSRPPGDDFVRALSDSFIPGSGCAVHAALGFLTMSMDGRLETAKEQADRYWSGWEQQSPANREKGWVGREQARTIEPAFLERLAAWRCGHPLASRYRVTDEAATPPPSSMPSSGKRRSR